MVCVCVCKWYRRGLLGIDELLQLLLMEENLSLLLSEELHCTKTHTHTHISALHLHSKWLNSKMSYCCKLKL